MVRSSRLTPVFVFTENTNSFGSCGPGENCCSSWPRKAIFTLRSDASFFVTSRSPRQKRCSDDDLSVFKVNVLPLKAHHLADPKCAKQSDHYNQPHILPQCQQKTAGLIRGELPPFSHHLLAPRFRT